MTELAAPSPQPRERLRALQIAGIAAGPALIVAGVLTLGRVERLTAPAHVQHEVAAAAHPLHHEPLATAQKQFLRPVARVARVDPYARAGSYAAVGLSRGLFTRSPGGALATAARVAQYRPLIVRAARGSGIDPNVIEGIVFLESAGRADAIAGGDPAAASGLTQIVASTGAGFLRMRVHLGASRRLTHRISRAYWHGRWHRARVLEARRRRVDQRFDPAHALRGTVRYLVAARGYLGRNDLAVASYHMGIGNLQEVIRRWAGAPHGTPTTQIVRANRLSYGRLYFGSAPDRHGRAWRRL